MKKTLTYIPPTELYDSWKIVKDGIVDVSERMNDGWVAEDIYVAIRSNLATLHLGYIDDEYVGFIVLVPTQGFHEMKLMIWVCYSCCNKPILETFIDEVRDMAKAINAKKITFSSNRKGWEKRMKEFKPKMVSYEMEV